MQLTVADTACYAYTGGRPFDARLPVLVFVHGAGLDHTTWLLQARYLARHGFAVLAVDLPAHGRSGGAPIDSIAGLADWIAALLDAAGVNRASVIGHSMGAAVAIEFAARHAQRADAVAIVGAALPMPVAAPLLAAARANDHSAYEMITAWAHGQAALVGGNAVPGMWMAGSTMRLLERNRPGVLYADFTACNEYLDGLEHAREITCPALMVVGDADRMTPARAIRDLEIALPDARTVRLHGCGHMVMPERPDALLDALRDFLQGGMQSRTGGA